MSDWYVGFRTQNEYISWFHSNDIILPDITGSCSLLTVRYVIIIIFRVCLHFIFIIISIFFGMNGDRFIDSIEILLRYWYRFGKQNENELHSFDPCALHSCIVIIVIGALSSIGIFSFEKHLSDHCLQLKQRKIMHIIFVWALIIPTPIIFNTVHAH